MPYEILKHTADVRLRVKAGELRGLFAEALKGMMKIISPEFKEAEGEIKREVAVNSSDKTALLVDFLNEILALSQINGEVYAGVNFKEFSETKLRAELDGVKVKSFDEDVKAVTYHEADIKQNEKGEWETILIFDI